MNFFDLFIDKIDAEHQDFITGMSITNFAKLLNGVLNIPKIKDKVYVDLPVNKGKDGENEFEHNIAKLLPYEYSLINSSKIGHAADFIITFVSNLNLRIFKLMIDIKNYSKTVPTKEIEKMYADLNNHSDIHAGLMISYHSKFTGINKSIDIQYYNSNHGIIPMVFISINNPEIICEIIKLIFNILEQKELVFTNSLNKKELILSINDIGEQVNTITQCKNDIIETKTLIDKNLQNIIINISQYETSMLIKIKQLNRILTNEEHKTKPLNDVIEIFKLNEMPYKYQEMLIDINQIEWESTSIDKQKKLWCLKRNNKQIIFKFNRKNILFSIDFEPQGVQLSELKCNDGKYSIMLALDTLQLIKSICTRL